MPAAEPNRRERQKAETRAKILAAARELIAERGYADATIRDIAARADVAAGSVFTTFDGKSALMLEVLYARYPDLYAELAAVRAQAGATVARVCALGRAATEFELREPTLLAETMGASWTWSPATEAEHRARLAPLVGALLDILRDGDAQGELPAGAPPELIADVIFGCYVRNFRHALYDGWSVQQCVAHLQAQIRFILR